MNPRRFGIRLGIVLVLSTTAAMTLAIDIGISPARIALTGRPGETVTTTVTIVTGPGQPQQIAVEVSDWTLDGQGDLILLPVGEGAHPAGPWLVTEADAFEIPGNTARPFRLEVAIPDDASLAGTYAALVLFAVVPEARPGGGVAVLTTTQIAFTVYVTVAGTETAEAELIDMYQADDGGVVLALRNDGNTLMRLGGRVELRDDSGTVRYTLPVSDLPVMRESEREVTLRLPDDIEPGFYVALALVEDSRGGLLTGQAQLEVP